MSDWDDDYFDDREDDEEEDDICPRCWNTGRVPSMDYEAVEGHEYFACEDCEKGTNTPYMPRSLLR